MGLKPITYLAWARHAYSHRATISAHQSFDTCPYSHLIEEEASKGLMTYLKLQHYYEGETVFKLHLPESNPLSLPR